MLTMKEENMPLKSFDMVFSFITSLRVFLSCFKIYGKTLLYQAGSQKFYFYYIEIRASVREVFLSR